MRDKSDSPVAQAVASLGGLSSVARRRGLKSHMSISKWITYGIPAEHVLWLAAETGWKWTPHALAPHLYPNPWDGMPQPQQVAGMSPTKQMG